MEKRAESNFYKKEGKNIGNGFRKCVEWNAGKSGGAAFFKRLPDGDIRRKNRIEICKGLV